MAEKNFFTDDKGEYFTPEALELDAELSQYLRKLFKTKIREGYAARDIAHLIIECVIGMMHETLLGNQVEFNREKIEARKKKLPSVILGMRDEE